MDGLRKKIKTISLVFYVLLISITIYIFLDTFVIPHEESYLDQAKETNSQIQQNQATNANQNINNQTDTSKVSITSNSYSDNNISIKIETEVTNNTTYYVADITLSDAKYLKTALANNTYGRNIKETTSQMAEDNNAIFAINGDYYGFRNDGYVIRNSVLYRDVAGEDTDALVIDENGDFSIVKESDVSAQNLLNSGAYQVLSFGPGLIEDGQVIVDENDEVAQAKTSNPRTAIGQIDKLHYIVIVADGRTSESEGLSLYELAQIMKNYKCNTAYNLDGGGSSTMYFNGEVVNKPTDGRSSGERSVSDIVYFGY